MAIRVPTAAEAAEKWAQVTPGRSNFLQAGIQKSGGAYEEGVSGAADRYAQGIQQSIAEGSWATGVQGKGSKYVRKSLAVGVSRWQSGVPAAKQDYQEKVGNSLQAIAAVTLPPRGPRRSPQNLERVRAVVEAAIASARR